MDRGKNDMDQPLEAIDTSKVQEYQEFTSWPTQGEDTSWHLHEVLSGTNGH